MPVTDPCKNVLEKSSQLQTAAKLSKKEFLQVLRRAGISEETSSWQMSCSTTRSTRRGTGYSC